MNIKAILLFILLAVIQTNASDILVLEDQGTQDSVYAILDRNGVAADSGGPYWQFTGEDLDQYKVIVFLNGVAWTNEMPVSAQQGILDFVAGGGSLFSIEWTVWYQTGGGYATLRSILPVVYGGSWTNYAESYYKVIEHPVSQALPDTFNMASGWSYSVTLLDTAASKQAQTIFQGSNSGSAVTVGRYGRGNVIHWNMGGHYSGSNIWTAEVQQLLLNIVAYGGAVATSIEKRQEFPRDYMLHQNFPNPFNPGTRIGFYLPRAGNVDLVVYNMLGQRVARLLDERMGAGYHEIPFDAGMLPSGMYFYQLRSGRFRAIKKMVLLR